MRLLILGGTRFAGRHLAAAALDAGHEVTLFNRGLTDPDLFPRAERLRGDRDREGDLAAALAGRQWDAVADCCGYRPEQVAAATRCLGGAVQRYLFLSTISVYADFASGPDESSPLKAPLGPGVEHREDLRYGALKARCEAVVEEAMPGRALIVRSGLLIGPHDRTQRFAWWVRRVAAGGEVLAPGRPGHPLQLVDARDLAAWMLLVLARGAAGRFNATSARGRLTFGSLLEICRAVAASAARFTWVDGSFLAANGVRPMDDLPLWLPEEAHGFYTVDTARAVAAGLTLRPLTHSVRAVLAELHSSQPTGVPSTRLPPEREAELLQSWHARSAAGPRL